MNMNWYNDLHKIEKIKLLDLDSDIVQGILNVSKVY